jgi:excisionase family DNA binding protein
MIARVPPSRPPLSIHKPEEWPALLTAAQVAELLSVSKGLILRMLKRDELHGVMIGNTWRLAAEAVWPFVPREIRARWPAGPWHEGDPPPQ